MVLKIGQKEDIETRTLDPATGSVASDDVLGGLGWQNRHLLDPFLVQIYHWPLRTVFFGDQKYSGKEPLVA